MENYNEKPKNELTEIKDRTEQANKLLLSLENVLVIISLLFLTVTFYIAFVLVQTKNWLSILFIIVGVLQFTVAVLFSIRIEQIAGCYECQKCGHRYVPKYMSVAFAMHVGRTRYMKCPKCKKASWQKKVIGKSVKK